MPQALQLLAVMGLAAAAAGAADDLLAITLPDDRRRAIARGCVRMHRMRILLDNLPGFGIDQPAVPILNRDRDVVAAGGALPILCSHRFGGFQSG